MTPVPRGHQPYAPAGFGQTGFVDAAGTGGLLAQVEGRTSAATIAWLNAQPESWRAAITHVSIDLSASYAKAVREALPAAVLVADRFHVGALANDMLTHVRQRVVRESCGRRGRKTDPAWAARRRLLTGHERLRPETFAMMWNSLIDSGDAGIQILQAYTVNYPALAGGQGFGVDSPVGCSRRRWISRLSMTR